MGAKEERRERKDYIPRLSINQSQPRCVGALLCVSPRIVNGSVPLQLVPCTAKAVMNTCGNCIVY